MSDIPTNHLLNFEYIADIMYEELSQAAPQFSVTYKTCIEYVYNAFDDLVVTRLAGRPLEPGRTRQAVLNGAINGTIGDAGTLSVILGIAGNADRLVTHELCECIPFPTWRYVFVARLDTTVRLEITGDRRLDEWSVMTQNGTLSLEEIKDAFTKSLKERAAGIVDGGIPIDMEEFVNAIIRECRSHH